MGSLQEVGHKEMFPSHPEPIMTQLNRLESRLRDRERELGLANHEIKALKMTETMKDKAVVELSNELMQLDEKLRKTEKQLEEKNLEIRKLIDEKKEALPANFVPEAALRRVHATPNDEEPDSIDAIITPLESDIRKYKNEIATLQDDKKALESAIKCKEMALIELEKDLRNALKRALIVEGVQNQNLELKRQIEILQEENKLLDKINHQKAAEVEKLSQTIHELKESHLTASATKNVILDHQHQLAELNGGTPRLQDKLDALEGTAKAEAQLKAKVRLRLKTQEESLHCTPSLLRKLPNNSSKVIGVSSPTIGPKGQPVAHLSSSFTANRISTLQQSNSVSESADTHRNLEQANTSKKIHTTQANRVRKTLRPSRSKLSIDYRKKGTGTKAKTKGQVTEIISKEADLCEVDADLHDDADSHDDAGSQKKVALGAGYNDRLQKDVTSQRASREQKKDIKLNGKDYEIKMHLRTTSEQTKTKDAESEKLKRKPNRKKEPAGAKLNNTQQKNMKTSRSQL